MQTLQFFWSQLSDFALEKYPNLNFQSIFASKVTFGGKFQWNMYTHFQITCNWARYHDARSIAGISIFLVALLCFCFKKVA